MVHSFTLGKFSLSISFQSHLGLFLKAFPRSFDFFSVLAADFFDLAAMLGLQIKLLGLFLVTEEIILKQFNLLIYISRLF